MYINWLHDLDADQQHDLLFTLISRLPEPEDVSDAADGASETVALCVEDCKEYGAV